MYAYDDDDAIALLINYLSLRLAGSFLHWILFYNNSILISGTFCIATVLSFVFYARNNIWLRVLRILYFNLQITFEFIISLFHQGSKER